VVVRELVLASYLLEKYGKRLPAGDVSHKPSSSLQLPTARLVVTFVLQRHHRLLVPSSTGRLTEAYWHFQHNFVPLE